MKGFSYDIKRHNANSLNDEILLFYKRYDIRPIRHQQKRGLAPAQYKKADIKQKNFEERCVMNIKSIALAITFLLSGAFAFAESVHLPQAVEHTKEAITHGKEGHASVLVEHATAALTHAKESEQAEANPHTAEGITHLKAAIDVGNKGDAKGATTHAEEALKHLEMASKSKK